MTAPSPDRLNRLLAAVLHWGAVTSTVLLGTGLVLLLAGLRPAVSTQLTRMGLIVLMATPVVRVVVSVAEYAVEKDWTFLALTATVLLILLGSLMVGMG